MDSKYICSASLSTLCKCLNSLFSSAVVLKAVNTVLKASNFDCLLKLYEGVFVTFVVETESTGGLEIRGAETGKIKGSSRKAPYSL